MIYAAVVAGTLLLLVIAMFIIGTLLPKEHVAVVSGRVDAGIEDVFATLRDVSKFAEWRPDVKSVDVLPDSDGHRRWKENLGSMVIALEEVEAQAPRRLINRIADPTLPFCGTWIYELRPDGAATSISITENGEVRPPLFRFMSRFIFGHSATMRNYVEALRRKYEKET
jgi:hypothetical protein